MKQSLIKGIWCFSEINYRIPHKKKRPSTVQKEPLIKKLPRKIKNRISRLLSINFKTETKNKKKTFDQRLEFSNFSERPLIIDYTSKDSKSLFSFKQKYPNANIFQIKRKQQDSIFTNASHIIEQENVFVIDEKEFESFWSECLNGTTPIENSTLNKKVISILLLAQDIDLLKMNLEGVNIEYLEFWQKNLHKVRNIFIDYRSTAEAPQLLGKIFNILENANFRVFLHQPKELNSTPFINYSAQDGFDMILHIYGVRNKIYH